MDPDDRTLSTKHDVVTAEVTPPLDVPPNYDATLSIKSQGGSDRTLHAARVSLHPHRLEPVAAARSRPEIDYELTRVLGKGGMGVVYAARQASLDRQIAVKMIQGSAEAEARSAAKFLAEAIVTGELDHPNIVPVHDLGKTPDGKLFYAMKEVVGTSWDKVIGAKPLDENLRILLAVCDAVAFAHSRGVMHRDLKPANVMLGDFGEVMVMDWGLAASIGSEKAEPLTDASALAGTPAYMAPEMAACEYKRIGIGSDIYLLGGILYEIVTGLRPHPGDNARAALQAAVNNSIQPTDQQGELVDIALRAMAANPEDRYRKVSDFQQALRNYQAHAESLALSQAADTRLAAVDGRTQDGVYRECTEIIAGFQQAIQLWQGNGRAVFGLRNARETMTTIALQRGDLALAASQLSAMDDELALGKAVGVRLSPPTRLRRSVETATAHAARRRRMMRLSLGFALFAGAMAFAVMVMAYVATRRERDRAVNAEARMAMERNRAIQAEQTTARERDRAEAAKLEEARQRLQALQALRTAEQEAYYQAVALAQRRLGEGQTVEAEQLLTATPRRLRGWEWGHLMLETREALAILRGHEGPITSLSFSPDGRLLVSEAADLTVRVWNLDGPRLAGVFRGLTASPLRTAFADDGHTVVQGIEDGRALQLDIRTRRTRATPLEGFFQSIYITALLPDGRRIVASDAHGNLGLWNLKDGQKTATLRGHRAAVRCAAFAPDGRRLLTGGDDGTARLWDLATLESLRILGGHDGAVTGTAFTPDGNRVVTVDHQGVTRIWTADEGTIQSVIPFRGMDLTPASLVLNPAARLAITAGPDTMTRLWDMPTGRRRGLWRGHRADVSAAALSRGNRLAASGDRNGIVRIWDTVHTDGAYVLQGHTAPLAAAAFSPDGAQVLTGDDHGILRCWNTQSLAARGKQNAHKGRIRAVGFLAEGKRCVSVGDDGFLRFWDPASGATNGGWRAHDGPVTGMDLTADGKRVATAGADGVRIWRLPDGEPLATLSGMPPLPRQVQWAPDGARIVTIDQDAVRIWDARAGQPLFVLAGHAAPADTAVFSRDGQRLLTGSRDGTARVWDADHGTCLLVLPDHRSAVSTAAFSPDGLRIVTADKYGLRVWHAGTGRELLLLRGHSDWIGAVAFSPDGRTLLSGGNDGTARLWPAADWTVEASVAMAARDAERAAQLRRVLTTATPSLE